MNVSAKIFLFLMLVFVTISVCSCGKASRPSPLEGSGYPHSYPKK